jgi:hypothetical protein
MTARASKTSPQAVQQAPQATSDRRTGPLLGVSEGLSMLFIRRSGALGCNEQGLTSPAEDPGDGSSDERRQAKGPTGAALGLCCAP